MTSMQTKTPSIDETLGFRLQNRKCPCGKINVHARTQTQTKKAATTASDRAIAITLSSSSCINHIWKKEEEKQKVTLF